MAGENIYQDKLDYAVATTLNLDGLEQQDLAYLHVMCIVGDRRHCSKSSPLIPLWQNMLVTVAEGKGNHMPWPKSGRCHFAQLFGENQSHGPT